MEDFLTRIDRPIAAELANFVSRFHAALSHDNGLLGQALEHVRRQGGKRLRPRLVLLMARNYGAISDTTQNAAVGLELLHTASLVHDDVVDESAERRGQASVNAVYDNQVAVLVGDYILSTALLHVSLTRNNAIVSRLARLGQTLSNGELLQLTNIDSSDISEDVYFQVISQKTAALFEACCTIGAISAGAPENGVGEAARFGRNVGVMFQIRDDIFDYFDASNIGKPTGNDMAEGKLTLPAIHALQAAPSEEMMALARRVKQHTITPQEIAQLVDFTKRNGGIEYARQRMADYQAQAAQYIDRHVADEQTADALRAFIDFVVERSK